MESPPEALEPTKRMLLSWFHEDELEICPRCSQKHVLPPGSESDPNRICLTCGMLPPVEEVEAARSAS